MQSVSSEKDEGIIYLVAEGHSIEDRKKVEQKLKENEINYQRLFERSTDPQLLIDGEKFVSCNAAAVKILDYKDEQEAYNTHPSSMSPEFQPDGRTSFEKANELIEITFAQGSNRFEWDHQRKNGDIFPVEVVLTAIPFEDRELLHVVWRDIKQLQQQRKQLALMAHYDVLTKLPNRALFVDRFELAMAQSNRSKKRVGYLFSRFR